MTYFDPSAHNGIGDTIYVFDTRAEVYIWLFLMPFIVAFIFWAIFKLIGRDMR